MDLISLIAGAVVATALAVAIFTQRERIRSLGQSVALQASSTRERLTRSAEASYREAVIELANGLHVAGHLVPLERIAVIPRFTTPREPFDPLERENPEHDHPHHLLPFAPDWPEAVAPYYVPGVPLSHLLRGEGGVAVLGQPGSGRTVALALMALLVARQTEDNQPGGLVAQARIPLYFHLADAPLGPGFFEPGADPLDPLLEAARPHLRGAGARLLGALAGEFAAGRGLIFADGWDELAPAQQPRATAWLQALAGVYPGNKLVVSGPAVGYGPLLAIGLAPAFISAWAGVEHAEVGRRWAEAWPDIGATGREPAPAPADDLIRRAVRGNRARTALDVTLRVWATFAGDDPGEGRIGWYRAYLRRVAPAPDLYPALHRMAEQTVLAPPAPSPQPEDEQPAIDAAPLPPDAPAPGLAQDDLTALVNAVAKSLDGRPSMSTPDFIFALTGQTHVLARRPDRRLTFAQPLVAAYLAAEALRDADLPDDLLASRPINRLVMAFLAQLRDVTPYVEQRLAAPDTILRGHILDLAAWAADADPRARWRGEAYKRLAELLLRPVEFPVVRERAMAALVASRDSNVAYIFREALKSDDPRLRVLGVLGLGALGDPETVITLGEMIEDPDPAVEVATGLALGAIGTKTALNYMIQMLLTARDLARRGVAEMLAATNIAGEGHDVLREAAQEADAKARKAAIYGLARIDEPWAFEIIEELERQDDQWLVRAAAGGLMDLRRAGESLDAPPQRTSRPEETVWLAQWLEGRGESAAPGPQGISQLVRALQEGDEAIRLAAVEALGALGAPDAIKPLYAALHDPHPEIRDTAYRALAAISLATAHPLPGVGE